MVKRYILGVITGLILGSIGVYAALTIKSTNVTFTPEDSEWDVTSVSEALNDLYKNSSLKVYEEGTYTSYIAHANYVEATLNLANTYTEDDNAYLFITGINYEYAPIYFRHEFKNKIIGNSLKFIISNGAGSSSYDKTYVVQYKIIKVDK